MQISALHLTALFITGIRAGHISDQDIFRTTCLTYKFKSISKKHHPGDRRESSLIIVCGL
ncbi:hypothetical protein PF010_g24489 [Phytophthora fragariae]|uniref:Uncharacterized protein n=1 Tax=Phytophthora fragariae TaxID=53985 RepID=A0A6A4BUG8_9STRA|nr:hypothetical protein PF003_g198 [Phytophthora fragariae]KAE8977203.1 hypothetical protein PF011_g23747 [Phytophthora fragariae]KAE9074942.1 hypothetical protein PF010_g24489 [Phytophthora fragariae]KAE9075239.1 hypothetical protein PF007_g25087 [Phytophthora fragariae]KAE9117833.1 hypothetical protein PF006_g18729 [Phytophthora fragariae]